MAVTALQFFSTDYKPQTIDYTQFQDYIERDIVESGRIIGRTFKGTFKEYSDKKLFGTDKIG